MTKLRKQTHLSGNLSQEKKINILFAGLVSVRVVKNCALGPENHRLPEAANLGHSFFYYTHLPAGK